MTKSHSVFVCQQCGYSSPKWLGRCPECEQWNSLVEEVVVRESKPLGHGATSVYNPPQPITQITVGIHSRRSSGISEFDRVLGGGIVAGSVVLIGGDPGIGKSTLLTQVAGNFSNGTETSLYISGEESCEQIKIRADRLGVSKDRLFLVSETNIEQIEACISSVKPSIVIIDSIQTMYDPRIESAPATVSQVRSCTAVLVKIAKCTNIPIFIVGHVTKEGSIAGPRVLEHMVDTVLYFEGDSHQSYRILRAVKNRFGSTDEIGIFEMHETGLVEVANPSELLLSERPLHGAGSVVTCTVEGTRPLLVEVQALVAPCYFAAPRRMVTGVDYNRAMLVLAVLEKRVGLSLANQDVYINVAGGVKVLEPAADLAVMVAVASNLRDLPVNPHTVIMGEVGLAGEVRGINQIEKRVKEAARLGFKRAVLPIYNIQRCGKLDEIEVVGVDSASKAIEEAIGDFRRRRARHT